MSTLEFCLIIACVISIGINFWLLAYAERLVKVRDDFIETVSRCAKCTNGYVALRLKREKEEVSACV